MMKKIYLLSVLLLATMVVFAQESKKPASPRMQAEGEIDGVAVAVDYGAPSVKGRTIWGDLEKYDKVWRAGANENTTVTFSADVKVGDKTLKAGKYGFFIIPKESGDWVVIFNSKNDAWGAMKYKESEDVLRLNIKPEFVSDNQEQLKYEVGESAIKFAWAKARLSIPVSK